MKTGIPFIIVIAFLVLSYPALAQQDKKDEPVKGAEEIEQDKPSQEKIDSENDKPVDLDPIKRCFNDYTESDSIRFCLKVAYENVERKRRFIQEKMFEVLIEQDFMPEGEQARVDKLKIKRDALKYKNTQGKNREETKAAAVERIFAVEDERAILNYESKNESEREKALERMKASDTDFETYRTTECERQQHFYSGNIAFSQFVYFTCLQKLTEQRILTLQQSLK